MSEHFWSILSLVLLVAGPVGGLLSKVPVPAIRFIGHIVAALGGLDVGKVKAVVTTGVQVYDDAKAIVTAAKVAIVFGIALALLGCSHQQARSAADTEACLAKADANAEGQIAERCHTATFEACSEYAAIMKSWEAEGRKCR